MNDQTQLSHVLDGYLGSFEVSTTADAQLQQPQWLSSGRGDSATPTVGVKTSQIEIIIWQFIFKVE
jgi:hypothetical protein